MERQDQLVSYVWICFNCIQMVNFFFLSPLPKEKSDMREVHMFVTIVTVLGLMFAVSALLQYADVICCGRDGQDPLWRHWVRCFCPCWRGGGPEVPHTCCWDICGVHEDDFLSL